ncbi:hypothetical protein [Thiohalorhabdus sp.]|uniref:hypothetical protein n=1 Tax=Thiohalorhabdus sp. TaxID=3094134 RepID=UPI002FC28F4D
MTPACPFCGHRLPLTWIRMETECPHCSGCARFRVRWRRVFALALPAAVVAAFVLPRGFIGPVAVTVFALGVMVSIDAERVRRASTRCGEDGV